MTDICRMNTQQVCKALREAGIRFTTAQFMSGFWGTRISFSKRDKAKVAKVCGYTPYRDMSDKARLCFELYG